MKNNCKQIILERKNCTVDVSPFANDQDYFCRRARTHISPFSGKDCLDYL